MIEAPSGELAAFEALAFALFPLCGKFCKRGSGWPYARVDHAEGDDARGKHDGLD